MYRNIVTTSSDLELWTCEISYVSWIWFILQLIHALDKRSGNKTNPNQIHET